MARSRLVFVLAALLAGCGGTTPAAPSSAASPPAAATLAPTVAPAATVTLTVVPTAAPTQTQPPAPTQTATASTAAVAKPSTPAVAPTSAPAANSTPLPPGYTVDASGRLITPGGNVSREAPPGPSIPSGATGKCRDGTYSFAANHRGMCSSHGGVAQFYS